MPRDQIEPHTQLLDEYNRARRAIYANGDGVKWRRSRPLHDSGGLCRIEGRPMTGADEQLLARIVVHLAARVRAERVVRDELPIIEVDQDTGIARRRDGKGCRTIAGDGFYLRDRSLSRSG